MSFLFSFVLFMVMPFSYNFQSGIRYASSLGVRLGWEKHRLPLAFKVYVDVEISTVMRFIRLLHCWLQLL